MNSRRIIILGVGISGKSAAKFLYEQGDYVIGIDRSLDALASCRFFHERYIDDVLEFPSDVDLVVRSPGIKVCHKWVMEAQRRCIPIVTDIQLAFQSPAFYQYEALGVTGSNGKTTTTMFLAHLLVSVGKPAMTMGNIGTPILECIHNPGIRVVELSSFQLCHQEEIYPVLSGAVILNLSTNHLDYHGSMENYVRAKHCIVNCLKHYDKLWSGEGVAIGKSYLNHVEEIKEYIAHENSLKETYMHDVTNYGAAYVLANEVASISWDKFIQAIKTFKKPPHRIESLGKKRGVHYINDSKATTLGSVEKALLSFTGRVILILGGRNKGCDFSILIPIVLRVVKHVIAMGECRGQIASVLAPCIPVTQAKDLSEAVGVAACLAEPGDTVLLSPGCSSFDQFQNFEERGNHFRKLVHEIEGDMNEP